MKLVCRAVVSWSMKQGSSILITVTMGLYMPPWSTFLARQIEFLIWNSWIVRRKMIIVSVKSHLQYDLTIYYLLATFFGAFNSNVTIYSDNPKGNLTQPTWARDENWIHVILLRVCSCYYMWHPNDVQWPLQKIVGWCSKGVFGCWCQGVLLLLSRGVKQLAKCLIYLLLNFVDQN